MKFNIAPETDPRETRKPSVRKYRNISEDGRWVIEKKVVTTFKPRWGY